MNAGEPSARAAGAAPAHPTAFPEGARLVAGLDRLAQRESHVVLLAGAAWGAAVGALLVVAVGLWLSPTVGTGPSWVSLTALLLGAAGAGASLSRGRLAYAARRSGGARMWTACRVEGWRPESRNVVRTAAELLEAEGGAAGGTAGGTGGRMGGGVVPRQIVQDAAERVSAVDPGTHLPLGRPVAGLVGGAALGVAAILLVLPGGGPTGPGLMAGGVVMVDPAERPPSAGEGELTLEVRVVPPGYTGDSIRTYQDPEHLVGPRGSRLEIRVLTSSTEGQVSVETPAGRRWLERQAGEATFEGAIPLEADGYLLVQFVRPDPEVLDRRFVTLEAHADPVPGLRFVEPGQDLYLPDGDRTLEVVVEAEDDRGLSDLRFYYTRVSGFGELFEFEEGELPLEITRTTDRIWTGRLAWDLSALDLDRGDAVVYRAEARDHRPGAPPGESDTWTVEVLGSEAAPSGGFAGEDEMTRYALSQQMILLLTQRLLDGADTLSRDRFLDEAVTLAAAQRRVRAEFVFMLGGELEDEALHAAEDVMTMDDDPDHADHSPDHDHADEPPDPDAPSAQELHEAAHARADADAAEGRLAQEGRIQLARAIQAMAQAAVLLSEGEAEAALAPEETALEHLKLAFSSSRYLLRALSEREELDLTRRLTGDRASVIAGVRAQEDPEADPRDDALRGVLRDLLSMAMRGGGAGAGDRAQEDLAGGARPDSDADLRARLATRLTAADPGDPRLRGLATRLLSDAHAEELVVELGRILRERAPSDPQAPPSPALRRMTGAWLGAGSSP